mgnify:CR=1 FL=1
MITPIFLWMSGKDMGKERRNRKIHTANSSKFVFGADHFEDLGNMTTGYHKIKDDNILRGMELSSSAYRLLALLPIAKKVTQKILIFEKDEQSM